jgi:hypothetical protein
MSPDHPNDAGEHGPDYGPPPRECDPAVLDEMRCQAMGIAAQAEYIAGKQAGLDTARTQYEGARTAYGAAREAAEPIVDTAGNQLTKLIEQLTCLINDGSVVDKLDRAYRRVRHRLDECGDQSGCYCEQDCDYDEDRRCPPADVPARIADITQRTKAAEDCFADLIQEDKKLPERVAAAKAEVDDIETKIAGSPDPATFRRLYAAALVARRHLAAVWRGFIDVNAYVDCLCGALTCMLRGHTAIADLTRRLAEQQCHRKADEDACSRLRTNTVDEVLAEYLKICAAEDSDYGGRPPDHGDRPPDYGDRPREYGDRPPDHGDRPPDYGDRPPDHGDRPRDYGDRPPDHGDRPREYGDRPPDSGGRPPEDRGDRPPRDYGDRPPGDRPPRDYGDRPPGDRPPRDYGDRPPGDRYRAEDDRYRDRPPDADPRPR